MTPACTNCTGQAEAGKPHPNLKPISQTSESTIYKCKVCDYFLIDTKDEWSVMPTSKHEMMRTYPKQGNPAS